MEQSKTKITLKWFLIVLNCAAGMSAVLNTGWLFSSYYQLCSDACSLNAAQMGILLSITDASGIAGYIIGGYLADSLRPKACIVIGNLGMIALSLWCMTIPSSYTAFVIICTGLVLFGIVFYWTALVRYCRNFGPEELRGRAVGFLYGLSGLVMFIWGNILSAVIAKVSAVSGLRFLLGSSVAILAITTVVQLIVDKEPWFGRGMVKTVETDFSIKSLKILLTNKRLWVVYIIAMLSSGTAIVMTYVQPLLAEFYGCSTATVTLLSTWINNVVLLVMSFLTGYLVDKLGSAAKVVILSFICLLCGIAIILIFPWKPAMLFAIIIAICFVRCVNSICKPGRVALVAESGIPASANGTATGLMFASTSIPGTFMYAICGNILNNATDRVAAYYTIFAVFIGIGILGILAVLLFQRMTKKVKAAEAAK